MKFSKQKAEPAMVNDQIQESSTSDNDQSKHPNDFQEVPAGSIEKGNIFSQGGKNYRTLGRWDTILVLFMNQLGLGILSLPASLKVLGIVPGVIAIIGIGLISWYAAHLLLQFYRKHPHVVSIVEMTRIVGGPWFEAIAGVVMMIQVVFISASAVVTLSVALNTISSHATCTVVFILVACIACFILSLPRTMKFVSMSGIPNAVGVVAACVIALVSLAVSGPATAPVGWVKEIVIIGNPSFRDGLNACLRIVFAYGGNFTFVSYMAEMIDPARDFGFCLTFLEISSTVFYLVIAVVLYCLAGDLTTSPVLGAASTIPAKVASGIILPAVVATALSIGHTGCKYMYVAAMRKMGAISQVTDNSVKSWATWSICVTIFWIVIFTISNVIPIFDSVLSITAATTIPWFTYFLAATFWFHSNWNCLFENWKKTSLAVLNAFFIIMSFFLNAAGIWAAVTELLDLFETGDGIGGVFDCGNNAL
ncbi:transmembrane amino acid transporter protein-domain-containing protein [Dactylonectria estremocensis]|uniref:Transmembrane amino acid transporter protein-domain-containing protein n=1 Tax=Dactylonectria estremocensis TaxID=1079267 RepID=A0A9P9J6S7_9HYPO|nr:transmembrane amino acid transporter protein-domain-containing protein [Dactylonectria estremocensis]